MSQDTHVDAMLRHLGAAYYESPVAVRLIWDIDGVVDVVEKLDTPASARQ
jgi:hypothetical protein